MNYIIKWSVYSKENDEYQEKRERIMNAMTHFLITEYRTERVFHGLCLCKKMKENIGKQKVLAKEVLWLGYL